MKSKNILDEMQDQKRLKIESFGLWIAYFSLAASIFVQIVITRESILRTIAGELIILLVLGIYCIVNYIKQGLWSTTTKPSFKTNCIPSACAGLIVALFGGGISYVRIDNLIVSIAIALSAFLIIFALCLGLLTLCAQLYKRRIKKLEDAPEILDDRCKSD